ncbi:hypothetical protein SAMN02745165_03094 [Malonomonas rubra DSM 5091]|uniref:Uncharacterized protein n=1 Tax=Malonomonas rubra DSM 5091 TaxID=1122189 RepID=A0A1M6LXC3_MALRU|nr:hypothetical protein SAMN02745165_03094 [Malonomonas rubra DSM 5091]
MIVGQKVGYARFSTIAQDLGVWVPVVSQSFPKYPFFRFAAMLFSARSII